MNKHTTVRHLALTATAAAALATGAALAAPAIANAAPAPMSTAAPAASRYVVIDAAAVSSGHARTFSTAAAAQRYAATTRAAVSPNTAGATSFDLFSDGSYRGYSLHLAGVGTSRNLTDFAMCFLCGNWNDQASSITNGGTPVWLYSNINRLGTRYLVNPWVQGDLSRWGANNVVSSYYIGANPPN